MPSVEDLAVAINAVSDSITGAGHGERLLCAVFAFAAKGGAQATERQQPIYFIYNYKRGFWYPFVPAPGSEQRLDRARAPAQGADGEGTADRARTRALVPAVGDPDLASRRRRGAATPESSPRR